MWLGPGIMGGLCLLFGIIPWWVSDYLIQPAVRAFSVVEQEVQLAIFHGFNTPLLLSIVTLTMGGMIYFFRKRVQAAVKGAIDRLPLTGQRSYEISLKGILVTAHAVADRFAERIIASLPAGHHRRVRADHCRGLVAQHRRRVTGLRISGPAVVPLVAGAVMAVAVLVVVRARSRILAVSALGMVGGGAALVFLVYGAPDLALTQLLVETLTLIIVSIVLLRLPSIGRNIEHRSGSRWVDGLVAVGTGIVIAALCMATPMAPSIVN
jgi:multicomponent Na+:H+ antiporter subunit A